MMCLRRTAKRLSKVGLFVESQDELRQRLLKTEEFTEAEMEAIEKMVDRISEKLLNDGEL
jgi:hypothetical protein